MADFAPPGAQAPCVGDLYHWAKFVCYHCDSFGCRINIGYISRVIRSIVWKHNVIHKTGSTLHSDRNVITTGPSHFRQQFFWCSSVVWFSRYGCWKPDRQSNKQANKQNNGHSHHNTSHLSPERGGGREKTFCYRSGLCWEPERESPRCWGRIRRCQCGPQFPRGAGLAVSCLRQRHLAVVVDLIDAGPRLLYSRNLASHRCWPSLAERKTSQTLWTVR